MAIQVYISPNESLFLRDPQATALGKQIITAAIVALDELGLERLTFRKLAAEVGCTEASIYRYFSGKQQLLLYLVSWYWDWVHHLIRSAAQKASGAVPKLRAAVTALTRPMVPNPDVPYVDERILHHVVITEGMKAYYSKTTDAHNRAGVFLPYKQLVETLADLIAAVRADFEYPRTLATTLFEMAHCQIYYAEHLPRLTDMSTEGPLSDQVALMLQTWIDRLLLLEDERETHPATPSLSY